MTLEFTAEELALLFTLYRQPLPPPVEGVFSGAQPDVVEAAVRSFHAGYVERGLFAPTGGDDFTATGELADILSVCVDAHAFFAVEAADDLVVALYIRDDSGVELAHTAKGFSLRRVDGRAAREETLLRALDPSGGLQSGPDALAGARLMAVLPLADADSLFAAGEKHDAAAIRAFCEPRGLDTDAVSAFLDVAYARKKPANLPRATATIQDETGTAITRVLGLSGGLWALKWLLLSETEMYSVLAHVPGSEALDLVLDFAQRPI
jgi:hypothetical protein